MRRIEIGVKAIIERDDAILLIRRSEIGAISVYQNLTSAWDIPGGRINFTENLEEGLEREVAEETRLRIKEIRGVLEVKKVFRNERECIVRVTYVCSVYDGSVILSREHTEAEWFQKQALTKLEYKDNVLRDTIEKYCKTRLK